MLLNQEIEDSEHSFQITTVALLDEWLFFGTS